MSPGRWRGWRRPCCWWTGPAGSPLALVLAGDACAAVTVAVTLAAALPAHARLARGWDPAVLRGLLRANAVRLAAWAGAAGCGVALLVR